MKCFIPAGLLAATLLLGCSDDHEPVPPATDAGSDASADVTTDRGAPPDVSADVARGDGYIDLFDVFPLPDAGCPNCIRDRCGAQINACFNNPACATGLLCTLQTCGLLGEGGLNPSAFVCVLGCFNGDQATALAAIGGLQCLTMTCGSVCNFLDAGGGGRFDARPPDVTDASLDRAGDAGPDTMDPDASEDASLDVSTPDSGAPDAGSDGEADADAHADVSPDVPADDGDGNVGDSMTSDVAAETSPPGDDAAADATIDASEPDADGSMR